MKAIILAGGLGTRLRPLTDTTPKPLLPIKNKPIIEHTINNLKKHGITDIILSIGYKADQIMEYFGDGSRFGVYISYCIEDDPLGTGGAVKQAAKNIEDEHFILIWGDNLMDLDVTKMKQSHETNNALITMTLTFREDVENFGVVKLDQNKIIGFIEKPERSQAPSNLINAGAFIINKKALAILPEGKSNIERECFEKLAEEGVIFAHEHNGQWYPTDNLEKYQKANEEFNP